MINYYSPLVLPSNGLEYDPIIYLRELTVGSIFIHYDSFYVNSEINRIIAILNNHFRHKEIKNVSDMYYNDIIYVWNYLCSHSFNINHVQKSFMCSNCQKVKNIKISLKDINVHYLQDAQIEKKIKIKDFNVVYRRRKMADNVHFSFYTLSDNENNIEYIYNYTKHQILYIEDLKNKKKINKENYKDFLNFIGIKNLLNYFKEIRLEDFGFESDYFAICDFCQFKNEIKIIDPIDISFFHKGLQIDNQDYKTFVETLMTINSLKYINFNELLEIPNSKLTLIIEAAKKLNDQKYGKNKSTSYFDQIMEDM
jgi:hypothetical protein